MMRWILRLECSHALASDDNERTEREYCPECGFEVAVIDVYAFRDEEAAL